eukprot:Gb_15555 [translate_table: standard]
MKGAARKERLNSAHFCVLPDINGHSREKKEGGTIGLQLVSDKNKQNINLYFANSPFFRFSGTGVKPEQCNWLAQYPSNVLLPEASWTRFVPRKFKAMLSLTATEFERMTFSTMRNLLSGDDRSVITPVLFGHPVNNTIEDFRMLSAAAAGAANPFLFSSPFLVSNPGLAPCGDFPAAENELNSNIWNNMYDNDNHPRKRLRESAPEVGNFVPFQGGIPNSLNIIPQSNGADVSTGLRLNFEDVDLRNSTSGKELNNGNNNTAIFSALNESLGTELQRQRDEIEQYIRVQEEHVRQNLVEKTQKHAKALLYAVAEGVSRKLREKDLQVVNINRRNMELEERIKHLINESRAWQNRAKNSEVLANALRMNIEQRRDEQIKEGCGDSEEDAASCQLIGDINNVNMFQENKELEMQRRCRVCRSNDVSILLLPCRHLCLCKDCENKLDVCPICRTMKSASVQVYMS